MYTYIVHILYFIYIEKAFAKSTGNFILECNPEKSLSWFHISFNGLLNNNNASSRYKRKKMRKFFVCNNCFINRKKYSIKSNRFIVYNTQQTTMDIYLPLVEAVKFQRLASHWSPVQNQTI